MKQKQLHITKLAGLEELLSDYFGADELDYFFKKVVATNSKKISRISVIKPQKGVVLPDDNIFSTKYLSLLDSLITYIRNLLDEDKQLELLFNLGKLAISQGELGLAFEINNYILSKTKRNNKHKNTAAHAYLAIGDIQSRQALWTESIANIKKASKYFNETKDKKNSSVCENLLGTIYAEQGDLKKAKTHFEAGLTLLHPKKDKYALAMFEVNLGIINNINGELDEAHSYYYRALLTFEELNDLRRIAEIHHNLGMMFTQKGDYQTALKEFDESLKISLNERFLPTLAIALIGKAYVYTQIEDLELALAFADKGMDVSYKTNDRLSIADGYKIKGIIKRKQKNYRAAENFLLTSLRINEDLDNNLNYAETSFELGVLYQAKRMPDKANKYFTEALNYYKKIDYQSEVVKIQNFLQ